MNDLDAAAFTNLFKEAHQKCFGHPMLNSLSETESKLFSNQLLDQTGLVIGAKSIKNYSFYIINPSDGKEENPSVATLDTLARYVLNAPYTDEAQRKNKENHYPYWFGYKDRFYRSLKKPGKKKRVMPIVVAFSAIALIVTIYFVFFHRRNPDPKQFTEDFHSIAEDSLTGRGWIVQSKDTIYWNRRGERPGYLTLFTLKGDSWPDSYIAPGVRNLLLRKISGDCFTTELRLSDFIPHQNWQQAGILLLEDTNYTGKSVRLSLGYNDFFGGYTQKPEIIIQAISLQTKRGKPEELVHKTLFSLDPSQSTLINSNLKKSALRIEKHGNRIRFLYTTAPIENFAFKEAFSQEFNFHPNYVGIFALKGQVDSSSVIPASLSFFSFIPEKCEQ